jgi:hypothetical protein
MNQEPPLKKVGIKLPYANGIRGTEGAMKKARGLHGKA